MSKPALLRTRSTWVTPEDSGDINKKYNLLAKIGQPGQFGYARIAENKETKVQRAVKVVSKSRFSGAESKTHFERLRDEISVMESFEHPNIIRLYEVFEDVENLYLVMDLCTGGELFDRIQARGQYSEQDAAKVIRQMFVAVNFMHKKGIAHCDLKPDNFLFSTKDEDSPLKVIDFGMSKFVERRKYFKSFCGTPFYVAPEVIKGQYSESCDIWSLGVVLFVMLFGYPPFYADQERYGAYTDDKILSLVSAGFSPVTKKGYGPFFPADIPASEAAKDLISKLLTLDTAKRLTAEEALEHEWLTGKAASDKPILPKVMENIKNFQGATKFKTAVLSLMADSLTSEELAVLDKTFKQVDENGDGTITAAELKKALEKDQKELKMSQDDLLRLMSMADVNGDGVLSYEELKMVCVHRKLIAKEERIWLAFCKLDVNGDGRISKEEIKQIMGKEDEKELLELIAEVDKNGDGEIDYDEFVALWAKQYGAQEKEQPGAAAVAAKK